MGAGGAGRVGSAGRPGRAARASGATVATLTASTTVAELLKNECGIGRPIEQCVLVAIPLEQPLRAFVLDERIVKRRFGRFQCGMRHVYRRRSSVDLRIDLAAIHDGDGLARTNAISNLDRDARQRAGQLRKNRDARLRHEIARDLKRRFEVRRADG